MGFKGLLFRLTLGLAGLLALSVPGCRGPGGSPATSVPRAPQTVQATATMATQHPRSQVVVQDLIAVGPYLAATLSGQRGTWRFFFPAAGVCGDLLSGGGVLWYRMRGSFGTLQGEGSALCEPVGIASLTYWRDAQPRQRESRLAPRVQAAFEPLHAGGGHLLVRGRFPLALEIRWPMPTDTVAVLPDTPACRDQLLRTTSTLEFHAQGPEVFVLVGDRGECPIEGFAAPIESP